MLEGGGMVSSATDQGRDLSGSNSGGSMWTVVVLGIITAVFAWVWFGSKGDRKAVQSPDKAAETRSCSKPEQSESKCTLLTHHKETAVSCDTLQPESTPNTEKAESIESDGMYGQDESHAVGEHVTPMVEEVKQDVARGLEVAKEELHMSEVHHSCMGCNEDVSPTPESGYGGQELTLSHVAQEKREPSPSHVAQEKREPSPSHVAQEKPEPSPSHVAQEKPEPSPSHVAQEKPEPSPSHVAQEKPEPICKDESDVLVLETAETAMVPNACPVQDEDLTLTNGHIESVQEERETGNVMNGNALNVTVSPKQVDGLASENNFDHHNCTSSEQSHTDLAPNTESSDRLESSDCAQVNGHITENDNEPTETCSEERSNPLNSEDANPAVDQCNVLPHEEETQHFKGPGFNGDFFPTPSETKLCDSQRTKRVAAVQPTPHNVSLGFKVHYLTQSDAQVIAVTGDHEKLGQWENYVPLTADKDGNWSHSIALPADANIEWKFVMVENGKIKRWEECNNRHLRTAHEDLATQQWWGVPERGAFLEVSNLSL